MAVRAGVLFLGSCVSLLRSLGNLGAAGAAESGTPGHFSAALGAFGDSLYLADFIPAFCDLGGEGCDLLHLILGKGAFLVLVLLIVGLADGDIELVDLLFLVRDGTVQLCNLAENLGLLRCALPASEIFFPICSKNAIMIPPLCWKTLSALKSADFIDSMLYSTTFFYGWQDFVPVFCIPGGGDR